MKVLKRDEIVGKLEEWNNSNLSNETLSNWASKQFERYMNDDLDFNDYDNDENSSSKEVMSFLDSMNLNLFIKEDLPSLMNFLNSSKDNFTNAFEEWETYKKSIDYVKRRGVLKNNPFYSKFC